MIIEFICFAFGLGIGFLLGKENHRFPKMKVKNILAIAVLTVWCTMVLTTIYNTDLQCDPLVHGIFGVIVAFFFKNNEA